MTVTQIYRQQGIAEQTYYRYRKDFGGLIVNQPKLMKDLKRENHCLKKPVAD
jgi:hypothetical protein